ncbi:MAG: hypothetical protein LUG18_09045 [Candidatus Azobacteroides sp.]|nr:hypothetical protein [Candidatus Azobacteroides sp.]
MKTIATIYSKIRNKRKIRSTIFIIPFLTFFFVGTQLTAHPIWEKESSYFTTEDKNDAGNHKKMIQDQGKKRQQPESVFSLKTTDRFFSQDEEPSLSAAPPGEEGTAQKIQAPMNTKEYAVFLALGVSMVFVYGKKRKKKKV